MTDKGKGFNWQTAIALGGLGISLLGNWIQYQSVLDKKTELAQTQRKLDATLDEIKENKKAREAKRSVMEARMKELDQKIAKAESDISRGATGMAFAPLDQKELAKSIIQEGQAQKEELLKEKQRLQDKIDALPSE